MAEPIRVGQLLALVPGLAARLEEQQLIDAWPTIVGAAAARRSRAERIDGGLLHVLVDGSGWLHRLSLEEPRLTARCRALLAIRGIRFRLAPPPPGTDHEGEVPS